MSAAVKSRFNAIQYGDEDRGFFLESIQPSSGLGVLAWEPREDEIVICLDIGDSVETPVEKNGSQFKNPLAEAVGRNKRQFAFSLIKDADFLEEEEKDALGGALHTASLFGGFLKACRIVSLCFFAVAVSAQVDSTLFRVLFVMLGASLYASSQMMRSKIEQQRLYIEMQLVRLSSH